MDLVMSTDKKAVSAQLPSPHIQVQSNGSALRKILLKPSFHRDFACASV